MQPGQLTAGHFVTYPPLARQVAIRGLDVLQQLPLSFAALLLGEVIVYDSKFPAERQEVDAQFSFMRGLSADGRKQAMAGFERLTLTPALEALDWVRSPGEFSEHFSAHLWTTRQVSTFRIAAVEFLTAVRASIPPPRPPVPRFSIAVVGQGVGRSDYLLFRKLRSRGTYFTRIDPADGLKIILQRAAARAQEHAMRFGHWYLDGGVPFAAPTGMERLAYAELDAIRTAVVTRMREMIRAGAGTEARRSAVMQMSPGDVGLGGEGDEYVLNAFKVAVLSEGSGVQFFSTTFVQWAAREVLRRAQPLTLVARFAPRMTERSMNDALADSKTPPTFDPHGALVDADMAAYYTWLNQMRLTGAEDSSFVVWFEDHAEAMVIAPSVARGVESTQALDLNRLIDLALG